MTVGVAGSYLGRARLAATDSAFSYFTRLICVVYTAFKIRVEVRSGSHSCFEKVGGKSELSECIHLLISSSVSPKEMYGCVGCQHNYFP